VQVQKQLPRLPYLHDSWKPSSVLRTARSLSARAPYSTKASSPLSSHKMNGTKGAAIRPKRKQHPSAAGERPQKQLRAINGKESTGVNTPEIDYSISDDDLDIDRALLPSIADTAEWQATIENVVRNVVSIRFCQTCSFDTDPALTSEATGFVVDAEKGLVTPAHI
jgi:hypothetical protein